MEKTEYIVDKKAQISPVKNGKYPWVSVLLLIASVFRIYFRFNRIGYKIYSHDEVYTSLRAAGYQGGEVLSSILDGRNITTGDIRKFFQPDTDKNIFDTLSITANYQPHQVPLYFLITHYWMRLWGHTPTEMRSLALVFSLMCIPGMMIGGRGNELAI